MILVMVMSMSAGAQRFNNKLDGPFAVSRAFAVNGVCDMCRHRIESAVRGLPGIWSAYWNEDSHQLLVKYDRSRLKPGVIEKAVVTVGHYTDGIKSPDGAYAALPDCCHYRKG